ncbi:hypothetical protein BaRGS_00011452, partial [Batillaria attramentaria]
ILTWRIPVSSGTCLCLCGVVFTATLLIDIVHATSRDAVIQALTERFTRTSGEEFYELWHSDCHRRCRSQLIGHVTLACQFDPYRLTKRSFSKRDVNNTVAHILKDTEGSHPSPFITKTAASSFLKHVSRTTVQQRQHRIKKRGIMNECCYSKSCSWEEYAEFCHTYNRRPSTRDTRCYP